MVLIPAKLLLTQEELDGENDYLFGATEFPAEDFLSSGNASFALLWPEKQA